MKRTSPLSNASPDASLRVSKRTRDRLKTAAAVQGRPLYEITNELIEAYLRGLKLPSVQVLRRQRAR